MMFVAAHTMIASLHYQDGMVVTAQESKSLSFSTLLEGTIRKLNGSRLIQ